MIYRLRYCNKDGVEARVDIQKGLPTPVIDVEGTERPFILSYNNDKGNKSGMFLSSSADIEIYETADFNIDNLKTSNETELAVTYYINNIVKWQGFIIPDFFSIEVRSNPVIVMTASDRLGTLKNVTLSDLPSMVSLRELAVLCLNKTGLELPLKTMADFSNGTGVNDFFNSKILTQRLSDTKGRSISCYDILSSILTASNSKLSQRAGEWVIINKVQHEAGSGKLFSSATSFINWSDVIFNFSDINVGGRRTIIPVAASTGVYHEHGGGRLHPDNYDFSKGLTGWTSVGGFVAAVDNKEIKGFTTTTSGAVYTPVYGNATEKSYLINENEYIRNVNPKYIESEEISIPYSGQGSIEVEVNVNALAAAVYATPVFILPVIRIAVVATNGSDVLTLDYSGKFVTMPSTNPPVHEQTFEKGEVKNVGDIIPFLTEGKRVKGTLEVSNLEQYKLKIRIYGTQRAVYFHSVDLLMRNTAEAPKGTIFKIEQGSNYTKEHEIDTSIWGDYMTGGLNGYFYKYPIDDTSSLYNSSNELTSKWTAYNDTEQLPLLQHVSRQKSRLFSIAHDLLSAEIEVSDFDPLAIFVACEKRYTVVSAQFDFFKSNLSVELEEVVFQNNVIREYIYSYFGEGEDNIKNIGGISGGSGGGGTGGGLTPEQLEILSWWKKDPDNPNTIFTEMNAYSMGELSAYGIGSGGSSGGGVELLQAWTDYDVTKDNWAVKAGLLVPFYNDTKSRLTALEAGGGGSDLTVNTTGTGNAITSISKAGTVITATKGATFSLDNHLHAGIYEPVFSKNTAFNKNFGTTAGTVAEGNDSRIINGQTAFSWGNHSGLYLPLSDAVTLNTAQTITGEKTFDANITLGVNRYILGTDGYAGVWNVDNKLWIFGSSSAGSVSNIRSEKVGIGTDSPSEKLDVTGNIRLSGGDAGRYITINNSGALRFTAGTSGWASSLSYNLSDNTALGSAAGAYGTATALTYFFYGGTYNAPNMVILPNGRVGIGLTTPGYNLGVEGTMGTTGNITAGGELLATGGLRVNQTTHTGIGISLRGENSAVNPIYGLFYAQTALKGTHGAVTGANATYFSMDSVAGRGWIFTNNAGGTTGNVASISNSGNITASGEITAYVASDRRLKHNITHLFSSLDIIDKLNPVSYYWNQKAKELNPMKSDSLEYGLIAQEVENVLPGVVHGIFDDKYKSIDYIKLIPIMIAAIKELKQKTDKL